MATRAESISEVRSRLDDPYQQAPGLHKIVAGHLQFEQLMANRLNQTGKPWAIKSFTFQSDPATDTYSIVDGDDNPILDFGKPLVVIKATDDENMPFVQVTFDDFEQQDYGRIPSGVSEVGVFGVFSPSSEKITFYRENFINPVLKMKINPVPQDVREYTVSYAVGAIGRLDPITVNYALPEHAHLIEVQNALSLLGRSKWSEDEEFNRKKRTELAVGLQFELSLLMPAFDNYVRGLTHARAVEVDVLY